MATVKPVTKKKSLVVKSKPTHMRSLRRSAEESPFLTFRITQQSVYWLILCLLVLALGVWVITLTIKVQSLYDQVETGSTTQVDTSPSAKKY